MDDESKGLHIIFVFILMLILYFSYCALPAGEPAKSKYKLLRETQARSQAHTEEAEPEPAAEAVAAESTGDVSHDPAEPVAEKQGETAVAAGEKRSGDLDIIPMNNPAYKTHKKGIVQFTHKDHVEKYALACGSCHHDEKGSPLALTAGDTPKGCIECHKGTEKQKGETLGEKEKILAYHFEALHANCIGCHQAYNIEKGDPKGKGPAPTSCTKCHPKK